MKVFLTLPNYDAHVLHPPLGLGYLTSYLEQRGHHVFLYDGTLRNAAIKDYLAAMARFGAELVGISVLTRGHPKAKRLISAIKKTWPDLPVVIGGTQVTAAPQIVLPDLGADLAVVGEGEETLAELALRFAQGKLAQGKFQWEEIKGLAYRDSKGEVVVTPSRELIANLDSLPFPAWYQMPPHKYRIAPILIPAKAFPIAPILTTRGCPFNCSFCASNITWRRRLRFRSVGNVLEEIKLLKNVYGVREIHFSDDNLTMDIGRAEELCERLIEEKINLPWQCPNGVRIDHLPPHLLVKMRRSGCYAVGLGIESGNSRILAKVNKQLDLTIVPPVLRNLKRVGIESYGFFILGLPGDTKRTIKDTIRFALKHPFDRAWFNTFTPYPGSAAFNEWLGERSFSDIDWDKYDAQTAATTMGEVSVTDLRNLQRSALLRFYLRPHILWSVVSHLGFREMISFLMSRFFRGWLEPVYKLAHRLFR